MDKLVKVIRNDGEEVHYAEVIAVYPGVNSLTVERSNGTLILITYPAIREVYYDKKLMKNIESNRGQEFIEPTLCPKCGKPFTSVEHANYCK